VRLKVRTPLDSPRFPAQHGLRYNLGLTAGAGNPQLITHDFYQNRIQDERILAKQASTYSMHVSSVVSGRREAKRGCPNIGTVLYGSSRANQRI